jgi:2OG-Fe(II) oxygenase superfamily
MITIDALRELGFSAEEVGPRIFCIENFTTDEELAALLAEVHSIPEEDWKIQYLEEMKKNCLIKFGRDDIDNLRAEGLLEVTDTFADKLHFLKDMNLMYALQRRSVDIFKLAGDLEVTGFMTHQRLYTGSSLTAHFDQYSDKLVEYAAVLYYNDDYTEGEVFFPQHDLKLRPKPGSLLIFPGTSDYVHGVHPVGEGPVRYILPAFIKTRHPDGAMAGWGDFG